MLNLHELEVFLTAAELSNFSQAGRRLHLTQPAISQTIKSLEKQFRADLFLRQGRSLRLTEAGQALLPMARELLGSAGRLEQTMSSLQGEVIGEMTIGCSTASGKYLLPGLIARFRRRFPRVQVNVIVTSREAVLSRLVDGQYGFGISSKRLEHHGLEYRDFFTDDVILIAPSGHRWARYGVVRPDDLCDEPMILREEAAGTREVLMDGLQARGITPDMLNVAMVLGNAEAIVMAVEEGIGVAFVSNLAASRSLALGTVVEVRVEDLVLSRAIYMARNRRCPAPRAQAEFWNFVGAADNGVKKAPVLPLPAGEDAAPMVCASIEAASLASHN